MDSTLDIAHASPEELAALHADLRAQHRDLVAANLSLDLTRGKPAPAQLDLSSALLDLPGDGNYRAPDGTDARNYGGLTGLPEVRAVWGEVFNVPGAQLIEGGNSSLALMHDVVVNAVLHGTGDGELAWGGQQISFLCPVPGYDRHFTILEGLGITMIPVPLLADGPDMTVVKDLVAADPQIKGIWCIPKYSNPSGSVYSDEVVAELASMPTAATDFRIFWDNAYAVHHLTEEAVELADILATCEAAGNPERAYIFGSTSKITLAGSGLSFFGGSAKNVAWLQKFLFCRTIGPDKINELRHLAFLPDAAAVTDLMARHRAVIAPKFDMMLRILAENLAGSGVATWTTPKGGYFISLEVPDGCASRVVALAKEAGIALTPAGATFPYGKDPKDSNIRLAPTFPSLADLEKATQGLTVCVLLGAVEKQLTSTDAV
ncbi:aminotransferase class I/II-fold pyridoxal phosphate-dependent enzyme [Nakamurella antarctica]|uniref:Aminotransferase class I/II-fold pyridoxal phosphate-dependent enzyme n=1 Tax=Nakamurella antarctica TaxID=1902245 RepID=A0A3G8ZQ53_9ACTN|nr:aminotransferase class I/II-fold pyridoxal phosphate-dependent enzyme [Nakamurella antarctica]AZI58935.1 aminotransferase class I/II-fold pyridoxal phosphate-dependent enzyme [Nakamurella antarctica]